MTTAMTTGCGRPLIITGVVLAVVGGAMVWASGPAPRARWLVRSRVWRAR